MISTEVSSLHDDRPDIALDRIELTDVHTGRPVALSGLDGVQVMTAIRHRY